MLGLGLREFHSSIASTALYPVSKSTYGKNPKAPGEEMVRLVAQLALNGDVDGTALPLAKAEIFV